VNPALRFLSVITHSPLWRSNRSGGTQFREPLWHCGLDPKWYAGAYSFQLPQASGSDACAFHYSRYASAGTFSPSLLFDERWYRIRYPEVVDLIGRGDYACGWHHYLLAGWRQAKNPVWWFNENWYKSRHRGVEEGVQTGSLLCGFEHYLLYGIGQDLAPSIYFHPLWYRKNYQPPNDRVRRRPPILDYLLSADREHRCPAPFFDSSWYKRQYLSNPLRMAEEELAYLSNPLEHYVCCGIQRQYSPSPQFDERAYRAINAYANDAIENGTYFSGFEHYVTEGLIGGATAASHMDTGGVDYAGPEFLRLYERSLRLNLRQAYMLRHVR
jgi:hypothetical protein